MESDEMMKSDHANGANDTETEHDIDMNNTDTQEQLKLKEKASELEARISNDRNDYQSYVDLFYTYMKLEDFKSSEIVFDCFKDLYPLTSEIWLSWIKHKIEAANTIEEKEVIKHLFDKAVQDYLSVDLWLEYIQFSIGFMMHNNDVDSMRLILERAILACGAHVFKGALVWDIFKEFEKSILQSLMSDNEENNESDFKNEQQRRILDLYRRQLAIPLLNMEKTLTEFEEFKNQTNLSIDDGGIHKNYKLAFEKLRQRLPYEEVLMNSEAGNNLEEYFKYLDFELGGDNSVNDYIRIRCIFERAISEHPLDTELWLRYMNFMKRKIKVPEDVLSVLNRGVRNCTWSVECWNAYLLGLERYNRPKESVLNVFQRALSSQLESPEDYRDLYLTYLSYLRRQLECIGESDDNKIKYLEEVRSLVNRACDNLSLQFGQQGDPDSRLLLWLAKFEVKIGKDVENYHSAWERIMNVEKHRQSSHYWLQHIHMENELHYEKLEKREKNIRRLYAKALSLDTDSPELIAYDWLEYESLKGDFEKFEFCQKSVMSKIGYLRKQRSRRLEERTNNAAKSKKEKKIKESYKSSFVKSGVVDSSSKTKKNKDTPAEEKLVDESLFKKPKSVENKLSEQPRLHFTPDVSQELRTVFLSNLAFHSTEEDIKNVLQSAGTVEEVRLVKDFKGSSKGYGFVVFSNQAEAENALKMDRTPLDKRPMFISPCNIEKNTRKTGIRFGTGLEKNKLFVKGLPLTFEQKDVHAIFESYGTLKDVRIVTYRNGFSKGLAYVEYKDEDSAAKALLKTDGLTVEDSKLEVALSNPPEKRDKSSLIKKEYSAINVQNQLTTALLQQSSISSSTEIEPKRHARTKISLVPRALQVSSKTAKQGSSTCSERMDCTDNADSASSTSATLNRNADGKPLSNEDFRHMLLFGNK